MRTDGIRFCQDIGAGIARRRSVSEEKKNIACVAPAVVLAAVPGFVFGKSFRTGELRIGNDGPDIPGRRTIGCAATL